MRVSAASLFLLRGVLCLPLTNFAPAKLPAPIIKLNPTPIPPTRVLPKPAASLLPKPSVLPKPGSSLPASLVALDPVKLVTVDVAWGPSQSSKGAIADKVGLKQADIVAVSYTTDDNKDVAVAWENGKTESVVVAFGNGKKFSTPSSSAKNAQGQNVRPWDDPVEVSVGTKQGEREFVTVSVGNKAHPVRFTKGRADTVMIVYDEDSGETVAVGWDPEGKQPAAAKWPQTKEGESGDGTVMVHIESKEIPVAWGKGKNEAIVIAWDEEKKGTTAVAWGKGKAETVVYYTSPPQTKEGAKDAFVTVATDQPKKKQP
jgi:hypothetical protein